MKHSTLIITLLSCWSPCSLTANSVTSFPPLFIKPFSSLPSSSSLDPYPGSWLWSPSLKHNAVSSLDPQFLPIYLPGKIPALDEPCHLPSLGLTGITEHFLQEKHTTQPTCFPFSLISNFKWVLLFVLRLSVSHFWNYYLYLFISKFSDPFLPVYFKFSLQNRRYYIQTFLSFHHKTCQPPTQLPW